MVLCSLLWPSVFGHLDPHALLCLPCHPPCPSPATPREAYGKALDNVKLNFERGLYGSANGEACMERVQLAQNAKVSRVQPPVGSVQVSRLGRAPSPHPHLRTFKAGHDPAVWISGREHLPRQAQRCSGSGSGFGEQRIVDLRSSGLPACRQPSCGVLPHDMRPCSHLVRPATALGSAPHAFSVPQEATFELDRSPFRPAGKAALPSSRAAVLPPAVMPPQEVVEAVQELRDDGLIAELAESPEAKPMGAAPAPQSRGRVQHGGEDSSGRAQRGGGGGGGVVVVESLTFKDAAVAVLSAQDPPRLMPAGGSRVGYGVGRGSSGAAQSCWWLAWPHPLSLLRCLLHQHSARHSCSPTPPVDVQLSWR